MAHRGLRIHVPRHAMLRAPDNEEQLKLAVRSDARVADEEVRSETCQGG